MIQFKKVTLHNFGSYGHVELDLQNRGFCLVSGQNNCTKDNALSNGSGKSAIFSAICYALTGETINGVKANLKNINIDEPDCYVQLEFLYQKDLYNICRIVTPKSDLKIFRNDVDVSGKGIRESEKKLQDLLPELNKDLVASCIILGQGLPNKFSSFSPSGRKDLLEKLTKSDFMIEDIKNRIAARQQELSIKVRDLEDSLLANRTQLNSYITNLTKLKATLENQQRPDFDSLLEAQRIKLNELEAQATSLQDAITSAEAQLDTLNAQLIEINAEKSKVSNEELTAYNSAYTELNSLKVTLEVEISTLNKEITKLKAITDVCPTCGQHLPNVNKPDTSELEASLAEKTDKLNKSNIDIQKCNTQHKEYQTQINNAFLVDLTSINNMITATKRSLQESRSNYKVCSTTLESERACYNKLIYDKQNWDNFIARQQSEISQFESEVARLTNIVSITSLAKDDYDQRISIIKKMDQLTKRDFRGFLLANIINYIDSKAKNYCETVFGTRELILEINGNALDITYCGKAFDGLSGGEKQRVDLILQLAIRDLLNSYLSLSANILVLDEITDFLDKKSCQAVMNLLEKELNTIESVFIISHHADTLGLPIDSNIHVIKNELGISELM
jgi:DNA repair exonuclease SbcCD ATPase subunit